MRFTAMFVSVVGAALAGNAAPMRPWCALLLALGAFALIGRPKSRRGDSLARGDGLIPQTCWLSSEQRRVLLLGAQGTRCLGATGSDVRRTFSKLLQFAGGWGEPPENAPLNEVNLHGKN